MLRVETFFVDIRMSMVYDLNNKGRDETFGKGLEL